MKRGMQLPGKSPLHTFCSGASFSSDFNTRRATSSSSETKKLCFYCANKSTRKLLNQVSETRTALHPPRFMSISFLPDSKGIRKSRVLREGKQNKSNWGIKSNSSQCFPDVVFSDFTPGWRGGESAGKFGESGRGKSRSWDNMQTKTNGIWKVTLLYLVE